MICNYIFKKSNVKNLHIANSDKPVSYEFAKDVLRKEMGEWGKWRKDEIEKDQLIQQLEIELNLILVWMPEHIIDSIHPICYTII